MRKYVVCVFACLATLSLKGQTADELFIAMPKSMSLTLSEDNRLDLIDLYKAGKKAEVLNRMEDTCSILELTNDFLKFRSGNYTMELIVLQMINDSKIICLIQTVCAPVCDSRLTFHTVSWRQVNSGAFISPAAKSWFVKDGMDPEDQKVRNTLIPLDISLMQFKYDPEKQELLQYYKTPEYASPDDREKAKDFLKDTPRIFKWNQVRFE
jgi:hypothetical protein